jgi:hypothetical protein
MRTSEEKRDLELENLVGNLLIAQFQVERLKDKISDNLVGSYKRGKSTESTYKHKGNWFKISISVNQVEFEENQAE